MVLKKRILWESWKRKYDKENSEKQNINVIWKFIWLENQNYVNNIEKIMNDMCIHDIDSDDNNSDEYKESMITMIYEAFQVSDIRFIVLFQSK